MSNVHKFIAVTLMLAALTLLAQGSAGVLAQGGEERGSGVNPAGKKVNLRSLPQTGLGQVKQSAPLGLWLSNADMVRLKAEAEKPIPAALQGLLNADTADAAPEAPNAGPTLSTNFQGFAETNWIPPDPTLAVGPSNLVVAVNSSYAIYDKNGNSLSSSTLSNFFSSVLPSCSGGDDKVFDPWVIYDENDGGRFILIAGFKCQSDETSYILIAVSDDNNARGDWCFWATNFELNGSQVINRWADYPKVGVDANAVYLTANMFTWGGVFQYAKLRILDKAVLYDTDCPNFGYTDFWNLQAFNGTAFSVQPAVTRGSTTPEHLIAADSASGSKVTVWRVNGAPSNPSLLKWHLNVNSYSAPPNAKQKNSSTRIDTGDSRMLNAMVSAKQLWATHTTGCTWPGDSATRSCIRWYQIDTTSMSVVQQGTYGASGKYYYYPAIYANGKKQAVVVFSRSSESEFAGTRYTWRDKNHTSLQSSKAFKSGLNSYVSLDLNGRNRWGDYGGIGGDPSSKNCFWMHHEYAEATANEWGTWVGETCF